MLTCRELAQQRVSDYLDKQLTWKQHLDFWLHLLLCEACRRFVRQFRLTQKVLLQTPPKPMAEATIQQLADCLHHAHAHRHDGHKK